MAESEEIKFNILYIRFYAKEDAFNSSFEFVYTAFRKRESNGTSTCTSDEFDCEDDTCIDKSLKCDGYPNCKFKKDEICPVWSCHTSFVYVCVFTISFVFAVCEANKIAIRIKFGIKCLIVIELYLNYLLNCFCIFQYRNPKVKKQKICGL